MRSDIGFIYCMCLRIQEALEKLDEVEQLYTRLESRSADWVLYADIIQLKHIIIQLREMSRYWEEVIDLLDHEETEKWQEASLRDISKIEDEEASGNDD